MQVLRQKFLYYCNMKKLLLILFCLPIIGFGQNDKFAGKWIQKGKYFENILVLNKIDSIENFYNFSFDCWRIQYCNLYGDTTKFFGGMEGKFFNIKIQDNKAHYDDEVQEFEEGWELYNKGEEKCNVYFSFKKDKISVRTDLCNMVYCGFGVSLDGEYKKD